MASVWQSPNSINLIARFRGPSGKTINRSTKTANREEALEIAKRFELEAAREREKSVEHVRSSGVRDGLLKLLQLARGGGINTPEARKIILEVCSHNSEPRSIDDLIRDAANGDIGFTEEEGDAKVITDPKELNELFNQLDDGIVLFKGSSEGSYAPRFVKPKK